MFRLLLLAIPIVYMPNALHLDFETGVPGVNLSNMVFAVLVMAIAFGGQRQPQRVARGELTGALLIFFTTLVGGYFLAQFTRPGNWMDDLVSLKTAMFYPLLYFAYRRCRLDGTDTRRLIILVMIVAAVAGLEAVREGLDYGYGNYAETRRASGPFGNDFHNANRAGVFYAMFLPMFVGMALFFKGQKFWRIAALVACVILALAIMATYSRQSYAIGLLGLSLLVVRRNVLLAVLIGLLAIPAASMLPDSVTQRVADTEQTTDQGVEEVDVSTASRFVIWGGAMQMWQDHPLGVGLRRFPKFIGRYAPEYSGYDAHNFYVLTFAELGPIGLGALLWLLWRLMRLAGKVRRETAHLSPEAKALGIGFTVTIIAMAMGNLYGSPFNEGSVMANFWILCGLMEHYATTKQVSTIATAPATTATLDGGIGERFPLAARALPGRYGHPGS